MSFSAPHQYVATQSYSAPCRVFSRSNFLRNYRSKGRGNGLSKPSRAVFKCSVTQASSEGQLEELAAFLEEDLQHLFDDQGIDASKYESQVEFRDPITKYDSIEGYLFNIQMLRRVFDPDFILHSVTQSGPSELTTRWTMTMSLTVNPFKTWWSPELIWTGTSIMGVNPETGRAI
ncbi:hypothetical protein CYMTET_44445 [Cymbomonas tetramitiformis]|uniref:Uncharacterized protein n=1 Tax=Cymbomonas tetramitiformis TaxID=36881 RepID=A0AAE0EZ16_9CHLO|nr:hypothetical protein CYMTET_44445 [Cymbomonas tetramitiformis]